MNGNTPIPSGRDEQKGSNLIGTGEGESPLAKVPFQKIDMRTMESDMSSIKASGGGAPAPYAPTSPSINRSESKNTGSFTPQSESNTPSFTSATGGASTFNIADMSTPSFGGAGTPPPPPSSPVMPPLPSHKGNKAFLLTIIGVVILGLIAAAYFFLLPGLKSVNEIKEEMPTTQEKTEEEVQIQQGGAGILIPETIAVHASFFKTPADVVSELQPELFSAEGIKTLIQPTSTTVPLLKELFIKTPENQPISFRSFAGLFFPTFFTPDVTLNFESDFTFVSYANKSGTWLAFIIKLKDSADIGFVQSEMNRFQADPGITGFYLSDPGSALSWKDGKLGGRPASVLEFSTRGIEFAYTWFDRYLIVTTNLEGGVEAAKRLGF